MNPFKADTCPFPHEWVTPDVRVQVGDSYWVATAFHPDQGSLKNVQVMLDGWECPRFCEKVVGPAIKVLDDTTAGWPIERASSEQVMQSLERLA